MNDAFHTRGVKGVRKLNGELKTFAGFEMLSADMVLERLARQQSRGDERLP